MKKLIQQEKDFILEPAACDEIAALITEFCRSVDIENRNALRYRLAAEECLLFWLARGFKGASVRLSMGRRMLMPYIVLEIEGEALDPYRDESEDFGPFCGSILSNLRLRPDYSYDNGRNRILFRVQRKSLGQLAKLGLVIAASVVFGLLGQVLLPEAFIEMLQKGVVVPVYDTFFNILGCIAGPMIFLSVAWGIYGIGDAATLGRVGKRLMLSYVRVVFLAAAFCAALFPLFGSGLASAAGQDAQVASIVELILGVFPSTIIEPFATGNTLQIIFLSIVIGIALLFLGRQTSSVAKAIEQVNYLVQFLMDFISRLVPAVIFLVILNLIWSGDLGILSSAWRLLIVLIAAFLVMAAVFLLYTAIRQRVSPVILLRKSMPTFLVALATASSAAAFSSNMTTCEKKFGISSSLCSFGIPLGMVMHKPVAAVYNLLLVFFFAAKYDVSCSLTWIIIAALISAVLAIATPPIPGGGAAAYTILFMQLGIPTEALAVALTIDILTDFLVTAFEMFVLPFTLINVSSGLAMIDSGTLRMKQ